MRTKAGKRLKLFRQKYIDNWSLETSASSGYIINAYTGVMRKTVYYVFCFNVIPFVTKEGDAERERRRERRREEQKQREKQKVWQSLTMTG